MPARRPALTVPASAKPASAMPAAVVLAAHIGLHSIWATPKAPVPTGDGCADCLDDLRPIIEPLWASIRSGQPLPGWLRAQQSRALHNAWSGAPMGVGEHGTCSECVDDLDVMVGAIERALAAHRATRGRRSTRTPR